jgi:NTE family protein
MKRKKIGLALGAGGYRGLAHIGVIKALEENNIPIDCLAGSSAGALVGGAYLALGDIKKLEKLFLKLDFKQLIGALSDFSIRAGVLRGDKVISFIEENIGKHKIENLPKPFAAVTTNLFSGQTSPIMRGNLAAAIRASGSVPLAFEPVTYKNERYIDGVFSMPVPVSIAKSLGAEKVIAVNLYNHMFPLEKEPEKKNRVSMLEVGKVTRNLLIYNLALNCAREAEVVINPKVNNSGINLRGLVIAQEKPLANKKMIKAGYWATQKVMTQIKGLI